MKNIISVFVMILILLIGCSCNHSDQFPNSLSSVLFDEGASDDFIIDALDCIDENKAIVHLINQETGETNFAFVNLDHTVSISDCYNITKNPINNFYRFLGVNENGTGFYTSYGLYQLENYNITARLNLNPNDFFFHAYNFENDVLIYVNSNRELRVSKSLSVNDKMICQATKTDAPQSSAANFTYPYVEFPTYLYTGNNYIIYWWYSFYGNNELRICDLDGNILKVITKYPFYEYPEAYTFLFPSEEKASFAFAAMYYDEVFKNEAYIPVTIIDFYDEEIEVVNQIILENCIIDVDCQLVDENTLYARANILPSETLLQKHLIKVDLMNTSYEIISTSRTIPDFTVSKDKKSLYWIDDYKTIKKEQIK